MNNIITLYFEHDPETDDVTLQDDAGYEDFSPSCGVSVGGCYDLTPERLRLLRDAVDRRLAEMNKAP